ncbi:hypothetical protein LINGRAPRIM_LOCUS2171 [Linum grandiflorum]
MLESFVSVIDSEVCRVNGRLKGEACSSAGKSFAEVVWSKSFSLEGNEISKEEWSYFGVWAQRWWGVRVDDRKPLADDIWKLISGWRAASSAVYIRTADINDGSRKVGSSTDPVVAELSHKNGKDLGDREELIVDASPEVHVGDDKIGGLHREPLKDDSDKRRKILSSKAVIEEVVRDESVEVLSQRDLQLKKLETSGEETTEVRFEKGVIEVDSGKATSHFKMNLVHVNEMEKGLPSLNNGPSPSVVNDNLTLTLNDVDSFEEKRGSLRN